MQKPFQSRDRKQQWQGCSEHKENQKGKDRMHARMAGTPQMEIVFTPVHHPHGLKIEIRQQVFHLQRDEY
jgi:hypothetical protein